MMYLKVIWPSDAKSIHPAAEAHYDGSADVAFVVPPDCGGGTGAFYKGDFLAIYIMSESGKTLDKVRGFTEEEAARHPRESVVASQDTGGRGSTDTDENGVKADNRPENCSSVKPHDLRHPDWDKADLTFSRQEA